MEELGLVGDLALVAAAALAGGVIAHVLRLPTVLGYLAAGIALGPHTPGPVGDIDEVRSVADLGVALLMFTLGIRFSLRELYELRGLALAATVFQVGGLLAAGTALGIAVGLDADEAIVAGMIVAISSTMVALRLIESRGEIGAPSGRVAIVFALTQDIAVVPLIIMIPVIAGSGQDLGLEIGLAALKGVGLVVAVWVAGTFIVPRALFYVTRSRSRELFLLTVVALALGTASISFAAGLSLAFGAFLAGLLLAESEYAHRTLAEVFPLREVFAVVFFVAVGMLIDPGSFVDHPDIVFGFAALGVFLKIALVVAIALAFAFPRRAALTAGLALGNMGEFSFVLATAAIDEGIFDTTLNEAMLGAVLLSIAVSPLLFRAETPVASLLRRLPGLGQKLERPSPQVYVDDAARLANHAVVCGYNEAGREVARALAEREFTCLVIDEDPVTIRYLRENGVPCILGDPALPSVLEQAQLERARVLALTLTDTKQTEIVLSIARHMAPRLHIVALGGDEESHRRLTSAGADHVAHAGFEVGMELVRHTLLRFGLSAPEVQAVIGRRRRDYSEH